MHSFLNSDCVTVQIEIRTILSIRRASRSSPIPHLNLPRTVNLKHSFLRLQSRIGLQANATIDENTSYMLESIKEV